MTVRKNEFALVEKTPKNLLRHCGLDPQSYAKSLFSRGLRVKPAMTGIEKMRFLDVPLKENSNIVKYFSGSFVCISRT